MEVRFNSGTSTAVTLALLVVTVSPRLLLLGCPISLVGSRRNDCGIPKRFKAAKTSWARSHRYSYHALQLLHGKNLYSLDKKGFISYGANMAHVSNGQSQTNTDNYGNNNGLKSTWNRQIRIFLILIKSNTYLIFDMVLKTAEATRHPCIPG